MANSSLELFKLDDIDRKVFFWLIGHVKTNAVKSWIQYIEKEYHKKSIRIDSDALLNEGFNIFNDTDVPETLTNQSLLFNKRNL